MRMPGERLFVRALNVPRIQEILSDMPEDQKIYHLCVCYNCVAKSIMAMERDRLRESSPLDALIAAVELVHDGDFQLIEDANGDIRAFPSESLLTDKKSTKTSLEGQG